MGRRRLWTDEQFVSAARSGHSVASVLRTLGLRPTGANYETVHKYLHKLGCDVAHWTGQAHLRGKTHSWKAKEPLDTILVDGRYVNTSHIKKRMVREGILDEKCYECGLTEWRGKAIALHLEHKNGKKDDNRRENLCLLCPNCHSQTSTYCGLNKKNLKGGPRCRRHLC